MVAESTVEVQMNWQELLNRMAHWQRTQFPAITTEGARKHLEKEVIVELHDEPDSPVEWADALFMCIQGGVKAAGSLNKFKQVVEDKLLINEHRTWPEEHNAEGFYEHIDG